MERKGYATVGDLRGLLSVAPGIDEAEHERAGYVGSMQAANRSTDGPW
jgi:dihydroorotate dehydrogenase (fumarate)